MLDRMLAATEDADASEHAADDVQRMRDAAQDAEQDMGAGNVTLLHRDLEKLPRLRNS